MDAKHSDKFKIEVIKGSWVSKLPVYENAVLTLFILRLSFERSLCTDSTNSLSGNALNFSYACDTASANFGNCDSSLLGMVLVIFKADLYGYDGG